MSFKDLSTVYPQEEPAARYTAVLPLRTGGFVQTVGAALRCTAPLLPLAVDPAFAGYCLDAPEHMPAGSMRAAPHSLQWKTQPRVWDRYSDHLSSQPTTSGR